MIENLKRTFMPRRLRNVLAPLFLAAGIAALGLIGSARAGAEEDGWARVDLSAAAAAPPAASPSCSPPCSLPVVLSENFDNVTPPALPSDWIATDAIDPDGIFWQTSNSGLPSPAADTAPNAAWVNDPPVLSDKRLDSLHFPFSAASPQLTFRQNFNLEASEIDPNVGFDGGVLEISTDGGNTFHDILAAGGSFVMGGYNRTIAADRGSPIAGRQAWSGNSQGFITTVVSLPFIPTGGRIRWRMASDLSGSNEGWRVDTVTISWCAPVPCQTPQPRPTPAPRPVPSAPPSPHATPAFTPAPRPSP